MVIEDKQTKLKKQKLEDEIITVQRDKDIPIQNPPVVVIPVTTSPEIPIIINTKKEDPPKNIISKAEDFALFDPTAEFEELDLTEGDSLEDLVVSQPPEPIFRPTTSHKFKFFN
jgi:hypothetical protein